jgi:hypothetical protein
MNITDRFYTDTVSPNLQKFKGHAQIDLMRNGKVVKRVEHDNTITDAVKNLLQGSFLGKENAADRPFSANDYFAGCFLADRAIDISQSVPTLLPSDVSITAHAGQTSNDSSVAVKRGSPNINESHIGENNSFTYVWDWRTSEGNGNIGSVCLTHKTNGFNGIGTNESGLNFAELMPRSSNSILFATTDDDKHGVKAITSNHSVFLLPEENMYLTIRRIDEHKLEVEKRIKSITAFRFNDDRVLESREIETTVTVAGSGWSRDSYSFDGEYLYYINIPYPYNKIYICKIDINDYSSEDITLDLSASRETYEAYGLVKTNRFFVFNDYLYLTARDNKTYKINITNSADVVEIDNPDNIVLTGDQIYGWYRSGDLLLSPRSAADQVGVMIYKDELRRCPRWAYVAPASNLMSNVNGAIVDMNYQLQASSFLVPNFISTVNNLDNVVTKTPDLTMKLTYTISEV